MELYLTIVWRTFFLYALVYIILRWMGKREVGELSMIDLVIFVMIAEVASFAIDDVKRPILVAVLPMVMLLIIQRTLAFIGMKNKKIRDLLDGDPSLIIRDGILMQKEMHKQRYNLDDLFQQLREKQVGSISEVAYAYLESSGNLSIFKKGESLLHLPLIVDGEIQQNHLKAMQKTTEWLQQFLDQHQVEANDIFFAVYEEPEFIFQLKEDSF
ncbi:DUF421 domain-containing protein [Paenisporosarcina cavernae]|uniref:DUF421 domain-containing protein n=1 Tax=Paenisporosarcina cavernae TaxID=2320858 RepID=A0A385YUY5_9BACL|nr:DUF421 domain-containing protein [Paenisporosarcina cavernae]AYC29727.1 DUF421 domain-containing protein [Paenisporosarcina cavernae]